MIVYDASSYRDILLRCTGSVLPQVFVHAALASAVSFFALHLYTAYGWSCPDNAHNLFGFLVGFLLVFRSNLSYSRYWHACGMLNLIQGRACEIVRASVNFAEDDIGWGRKTVTVTSPSGDGAETQTSVPDVAGRARLFGVRTELRRLSLQHIALSLLNVQTLRPTDDPGPQPPEHARRIAAAAAAPGPGRLITPDERDVLLAAGDHYVMVSMRNVVMAMWPLYKEKHFPHVNMLRQFTIHTNLVGDAWSDLMSIADTPIPFPYIQMTKWFAIIYVYTLPFCLVEKLGSMTMFAIIAISLGFFGLDSISTELTDPFGDDKNDLPMTHVVREIEASTRTIQQAYEVGRECVKFDVETLFGELPPAMGPPA